MQGPGRGRPSCWWLVTVQLPVELSEDRVQAALCSSRAQPGPTKDSDQEDLGLIEKVIIAVKKKKESHGHCRTQIAHIHRHSNRPATQRVSHVHIPGRLCEIVSPMARA